MRLWRRSQAEDAPADDEAVQSAVATAEDEDAEELREQTERAVEKTRTGLFGRLGGVFRRADFGEELWDELEETLIAADAGLATTTAILEAVRERVDRDNIKSGEAVHDALRDELVAVLERPGAATLPWDRDEVARPAVLLVVGVNGAGKTTTIGKLAASLHDDGATVILAAADTFRAAAIDQLRAWGERAGVRVVAHQPDSDPGSVVYDAITAAQAASADFVIVDTAGRLHTKSNLMEELRKIRRIVERLIPSGPESTLLVLDATTGQNGLAQARTFAEVAQVDGIALAKLDGTSKGGIVFAIAHELGLPVALIGTGEKPGDLARFSAPEFVDALLG